MASQEGILKLFEKKRIYKGWFIAGGIALVLIMEYPVAEAITSLAWKNPVYSYAYNFISDLGVSGPLVKFQGRLIYSPLYWIMNTAFIVEGILAIIAAFLLRPLFLSKAWRIAIPLLAIIHGTGITLVAIFHGSPEAFHGHTGVLHVAGAALAIILGNIECVCAGIAARNSGAPQWFKSYSIFLGLLGIVGLFCLFALKNIPPGITERISVDTIITWDITTGIFLLIGIKKSRI